MPLNGDLKTMPLAEILQWAGGNQKTGVLELERNKIRRQISFRDGRIVACCSNDPTSLLGHFLISKGKITERTLRYALRQKEEEGVRLSDVLIEMGVMSEQEIQGEVAASAEETIFGLFEWRTAVFRFEAEATLDQPIEVNLSVEHTLLNGAHRQDELERIRSVFPSSGVVLETTDETLPANVQDGALTFRLLDLINGERTLAELLLQAHASEFQVLKLLFGLKESGHVDVVEERPAAENAATLVDRRDDGPVELPSLADVLEAEGGGASDEMHDLVAAADDAVAEIERRSPVEASEPIDPPTVPAPAVPVEVATSPDTSAPAELAFLIQLAGDKLDRGDYQGALATLDGCYRARPNDESVRNLMERAEASYLEKVRKYLLAPHRVPSLTVSPDELPAGDLQPIEATLLGMIDGAANVQSIVWLAQMRELEVLQTLEKLHNRGLIVLATPKAVSI